jgi:hypothetical protein
MGAGGAGHGGNRLKDRQNQRHTLPEEIVRWLEDEPATMGLTGPIAAVATRPA